MSRRLGMLAIALGVTVVGPSMAGGTAVAGKTWCMTYCDAIHVGCRKTLGWLDEQACDDWHAGCLDGCQVDR